MGGIIIKSIYKTKSSREQTIKLYDKQLTKLGWKYNDIFIETSFGKTHVVETGNFEGIPLLLFHGGNSTSAYNLLLCKFLLKDFHVFAVDIIGHPGKSDEYSVSSKGYEYGKWASEVIDCLGYEKMRCFGGSFGAGVLAKTMCVAPKKIDKSVLIVPSGINNALPISSFKMAYPLIKYLLTKKEKYIIETALFMAISEDVLDEDTMDILKNSFEHIKTKTLMPTNISEKLIKNYNSPTLVMASEFDCLFPASRVLTRAKKIFNDCITYELKSRGHMHILTDEEQEMIIKFLK